MQTISITGGRRIMMLKLVLVFLLVALLVRFGFDWYNSREFPLYSKHTDSPYIIVEGDAHVGNLEYWVGDAPKWYFPYQYTRWLLFGESSVHIPRLVPFDHYIRATEMIFKDVYIEQSALGFRLEGKDNVFR